MQKNTERPTAVRKPSRPNPVSIIGAGTIVEDGHLPAYRMLGLEIAALFDTDRNKALALGAKFAIAEQRVCGSLEQLIDMTPQDGAFDVATPPATFPGILHALPDGRGVLMQKPMGESLEQARQILSLCRKKNLTAAVNFQLRYAPAVLEANRLLADGLIGGIKRLALRIIYPKPGTWRKDSFDRSRYKWEFTRSHPHGYFYFSFIHLLDLSRALCGEISSVRVLPDSGAGELRQQGRKNYGLAYDSGVEATVEFLIGDEPLYEFGLEGDRGRMRLAFPVRYPHTGPDILEYVLDGGDGPTAVPVSGAWFPHAFMGPMAALQCRLEDPGSPLPTEVLSAMKTMAALETLVTVEGNEPVVVPRDQTMSSAEPASHSTGTHSGDASHATFR